MANKLTYYRGTTYHLTHTYTAPQYLGSKLLFTIKSVSSDTDATDTSNSIITPKSVTMTGSTFPQTTVITIAPTDIADTVAPGVYYYSLKIIDSNGDEYIGDSGQFQLKATSTNRTT